MKDLEVLSLPYFISMFYAPFVYGIEPYVLVYSHEESLPLEEFG